MLPVDFGRQVNENLQVFGCLNLLNDYIHTGIQNFLYNSEILFPSDVELATAPENCETVSSVTTCTFDTNTPNPGIKKVKLESRGDHVEVSIE